MERTFRAYGLNKKHNFFDDSLENVKLPGESATIINTKGDVSRFIYQQLKTNHCECCAIFALQINETMIYGHKYGGEINVYEYDGPDVEQATAYFQKQWKYKKCGLLQQINETLYRIIID